MKKDGEWCIIITMGHTDYLIQTRRALHRIPEPSEQEFATSDYIAAQLKAMGHKFRRLGTGIVCDVKGVDTSRLIALRCDIDALPIVERTDCSFKADGNYMHACGHDGHTAMLLCAAKMLAERKPKQNVRLLFQFGEEGDGGAEKMMAMGAIDGVDEIFAFHMCPELPIGQVASCEGAMFAGTVEFDVAFTGKSCHCACAADGRDALKAAMRFYERAQHVNDDCRNGTVFHIGKLTGGTARNVVANEAVAYCTLRYFDPDVMDMLMMRLEGYLVEGNNLSGTDHRVTVHAVYPPLINHPASLAKVRALVKVQTCAPRFTAEDFAFYLQKTEGCMLWLGCRDEHHVSPLHSDTFGFDEKALLTGVEIYEKLLY